MKVLDTRMKSYLPSSQRTSVPFPFIIGSSQLKARSTLLLSEVRAIRCHAQIPRRQPEGVEKLLRNNKKWAEERIEQDPSYFNRLCAQQAPEYLWIGCSDSRVPANVIIGLDPGELFVQRNVGNQASHTDLNAMSCLEYAVKELKVKAVILCGHYGCGAVRAALRLPSKTQGLVNCWISDIRECRNQNYEELRSLSQDEQVERLCELNVMRQTFHVCTSPVVQSAWDQGQDVAVYGMIYNLKDGRIRKLVGPLSRTNASGMNFIEYENSLKVTKLASEPNSGSFGERKTPVPVSLGNIPAGVMSSMDYDVLDSRDQVMNTADMASKVGLHVGWSD